MIALHSLVPPLALLAAVATTLLYWQWRSRSRLPLPPGPPGKWITGNLNAIPTGERPSATYMKWGEIYGPIVYTSTFGKSAIILTTAQATQDLLENRSGIYSDRPHSWMVGELCNRKDAIFLLTSKDPRFKVYRRLLSYGLNPRATQSYRSIQEDETAVLLENLRTSPDRFISHLRRNAGAVILNITYGHKVTNEEDYLLRRVEDAFIFDEEHLFNKPFAVDFLPWLRFLPEWFPFAGFKRLASERRALDTERHPYEKAKDTTTTVNTESFVSKLLDRDNNEAVKLRNEAHGMDMDIDDIIMWCSSGLYVGGAETTVSTMTSFFYLMARHPEIQRSAQDELDAVVGTDRLPTLDDRERLPYILALITEVNRWGPPVPRALPHCVTQDDEYMGYHIPKGATVMANIWGIMHDPALYPNPNVFDPTRHLGENPQPNPHKYAFGFGRRVCPGQHFAEMSLFLNVSNVLAAFTIGFKNNLKLKGEGMPKEEWSVAVVSHLKPFECTIVPRRKTDSGNYL